MRDFNIIKTITFEKSFRNESVIGMFDLCEENYTLNFNGTIDLTNKWNIGLIVGASGTGKSTIAKQLFSEHIITEYNFDNSKSIIDCMPVNKSVKEITNIFSKVGFSSPPSWLKPYNILSNGEKMRVELAYNLLNDKEIFAFDEFTSVVDRQVAKMASTCISNVIYKLNKQFIAISCHYDIIDWLQPDWIFDTNTMQFFFIQKQEDQQSTYKFLRLMSCRKKNIIGTFLKNIII